MRETKNIFLKYYVISLIPHGIDEKELEEGEMWLYRLILRNPLMENVSNHKVLRKMETKWRLYTQSERPSWNFWTIKECFQDLTFTRYIESKKERRRQQVTYITNVWIDCETESRILDNGTKFTKGCKRLESDDYHHSQSNGT